MASTGGKNKTSSRKTAQPAMEAAPAPVDTWTPGKGNLLEVKAVNTQPFRVLFEALKAVLTEANLVFSDTGLRMAAVDGKREALAHLAMPVSSFERFYCKERIILGVDIPLLQKIVRTAKVNDSLTFVVHEDSPEVLGISFENPDKALDAFHPLKLRSLPDYNVKDSITFKEPPPEMPSADFQAVVRDMLSLGATEVEIQNLGDELTFIARNGPVCPRYTQKLRRLDVSDTSREEKEPELARGVFFLKHLQSFTKATTLSTHVHLYLQTKNPLLICEYSVFKLGTLKYCLMGKQE